MDPQTEQILKMKSPSINRMCSDEEELYQIVFKSNGDVKRFFEEAQNHKNHIKESSPFDMRTLEWVGRKISEYCAGNKQIIQMRRTIQDYTGIYYSKFR